MRPRHVPRTYAAAALAASVLAAPLRSAHAQGTPSTCDAVAGNLVANCGFESGTLGPWVRTAQSRYGSDDGLYRGRGRSGQYAYYFSYESANAPTLAPAAALTQTLATTPGQTYFISFFARLDQRDAVGDGTGHDNRLRVLFGGSPVFDQVLPFSGNSGFDQYTVSAVATAARTEFTVTGFNNFFEDGAGPYGYTDVDDFIVSTNAVSVAPEPGTWALLATGLAGLGGVAARRRRAA